MYQDPGACNSQDWHVMVCVYMQVIVSREVYSETSN